ncbi:MAG: hypothetical protein BEU04_00940 [Marine Group III euryarchaeote CG-Bathy1]|uniref:Geranylgeranyl pyrophosphate synthase n=1 Tax=Marine Group III euryarchaeote CG-Bathy1 TaxID=1889001 RepID=A0A1J5U7Z1_9ARCH|nr:MAG: hypothetical protein BEU04_00940 [Marine Group III euryarchaeote CG-Bathy1]
MNLKEILKERGVPVENALKKYLSVRKPEKLYEAMGHIPLAGGKRLRPIMAALTCEIVGGEPERAIPYATALETIHNFTLVHDDVMDDDDLRHGVDACHVVYGLPTAINAGDALFAYSFEMITDTDVKSDVKNNLIKHVARTVREIAEGQQMDMDFENMEYVSSEEYLKMIELKTAILFGAAAYGGALIGGTEEEEANKLRDMAISIGLGFQIWDDYLDATASEELLGKPSGSDIVQGKRTLLVIKALEKAEKEQGKRLQEILDNDNNENSDIIEAVKIMKETGALDECEKIALEHLEGAKKTLSKYPDSEARKDLEELLRFMVERKY